MSKILIVGGGIGGVSLAGFLSRRLPEANVEVVEQAEEWAPIGAGISLTGNTLRELDRLGLSDALETSGLLLEGARVTDRFGRVLSGTNSAEQQSGRDRFTSKLLSIHRASLHEVLLTACPDVRFRLGATARVDGDESASGGPVRVCVIEGQREELADFDLVVGADGVHSATRPTVTGEPRSYFRYAGYTCWRSVVSMPGSEIANSATSWELWGRGKRFGVIPLPGERAYFYACVNAAESAAEYKNLSHEAFASLFREMPDFLQDVIQSLPDDAVLHHDDLGDVMLPRWSRGGVVLIGDAAHATTPNMGQGAALAIEDASVLSELLSQAHKQQRSLASCLSQFEDRRRPRVERLQKTARNIGAMAQWQFAPACWLRDRLTAILPNRLMGRQLIQVVDEIL